MKKIVKVLLALVLVSMLCFGPTLVGEIAGDAGIVTDPGPDDRPISYIGRARTPRN